VKKGEIKNIKILRGVNEAIDNEAIRVLKAMPIWKPGKQYGKAISVRFNLPIKFHIKYYLTRIIINSLSFRHQQER